MLLVPIKDVKPGMVVARAVCQARNGVLFVQSGYALEARAIDRLISLGVQSLWIECDGLAEIDDRINERVVSKRQDLVQALTTSVDDLRQRTDTVVDCGQFESKVGALLNEVLSDPAHEPMLASMGGDAGALVRHQTNCCYLSLLLGTHLSGYVRHQRRHVPLHIAQDLRRLGIGAFVHDLGKTRLPDEVQEICAIDPRQVDPAYRGHARIGCEMLRGRLPAVCVYLVAHHHQRFDGRGFPKVKPRDPERPAAGLAGERIHVFARILAAVNAFDHLLGTPERPRPTIQALHDIQQPEYEGWFDPIVIAAINRLVPPFMLGSIVTLTDGRQAVVVDNQTSAPCYPTVRVVHGRPGTPGARVEEEAIDLRTSGDVNVAAVDGVNVRRFFYDPPDIPEGVLAYWGLRSKGVRAVTVDPSTLVTADEEEATANTAG